MKKTAVKSVATAPSGNIFLKIIRGHYGLAVTFWGWGGGGGFLLGSLLLALVLDAGIEFLIVPFILIWVAYITIVCVGVWRSDKSSSFASVISKLFIVVAYPVMAFVLLYIIGLLTSDYPNH